MRRLANDLRSFPREHALGKVNAVHILGGGPSVSDWEAKGRDGAKRLLRSSLQKTQREARTVATVTRIERGFVRATQFGIELYRRSDFRTLSADLGELVH